MKFLLDTNTCVHYLRHGVQSPVANRLAAVLPGEVVLCSVVVGELLFGALRSRDVAKNLAQMQAFVAGFRSLPIDFREAEDYSNIRADLAAKGTPIGPNDLWIAATAMANALSRVWPSPLWPRRKPARCDRDPSQMPATPRRRFSPRSS